MKFVPKVIYGGTPLIFTLPQKIWTPGSRLIGGSNVSQAGVPETFTIRREQLCDIVLRFYESEWASVDTWLDYAQKGNSFTYQFDKDVVGTAYTVYLVTPALGDGEVTPSRENFIKVLNLPIKIRTTAGTRFTQTVFA